MTQMRMAGPTLCSPGGEGAPTTVERDEGGRGEGRARGEAELSWEMRLSLGEPRRPPGAARSHESHPATPTFSPPGKWGKYLEDLLSYPTSCPTQAAVTLPDMSSSGSFIPVSTYPPGLWSSCLLDEPLIISCSSHTRPGLFLQHLPCIGTYTQGL